MVYVNRNILEIGCQLAEIAKLLLGDHLYMADSLLPGRPLRTPFRAVRPGSDGRYPKISAYPSLRGLNQGSSMRNALSPGRPPATFVVH
jgi:hypothetical protein